eukprot:3037537-Amphidinium_carterae.1
MEVLAAQHIPLPDNLLDKEILSQGQEVGLLFVQRQGRANPSLSFSGLRLMATQRATFRMNFWRVIRQVVPLSWHHLYDEALVAAAAAVDDGPDDAE